MQVQKIFQALILAGKKYFISATLVRNNATETSVSVV